MLALLEEHSCKQIDDNESGDDCYDSDDDNDRLKASQSYSPSLSSLSSLLSPIIND